LLDINSEKDNKKNFILNKTEIDPLSNSLVERALQIAVLNNNASLHNNKDDGKSRGVGDPLEIALLAAGAGAGLYRDKLLEKWPEEREDAFDSESKMMATIHKKNGDYLTTVKGAPEAVIEHSSAIITANGPEEFSKDKKKEWLEKNEKMANDGLRILAIANKEMSKTDDDPYKDLQFLGLVGLLDPPRQEILGVLDLCKQAGIRVNMVTGDQAATALYIAKKINLSTNNKVITGRELKKSDDMNKEETQQVIDTSIFARVSPAQKLDLITVHQNNNSIVAMTGDGVNDAPALKKADIGVSMGKRGTQVAQEASDMVLKDDAFPSIVTAVEYGRIIFNNIRKFILFLLSGNVGEVLAVGFASFMGLPLPLLPLQILFINLVMDVFPALALGVGAAHEDVMKNPPRQPDEPVINSYYWKMIAFFGLVIAVSVLAALGVSTDMLHLTKERAVTISFLTLALARLWHIFNMREPGSPFFKNEVTRNPFVWGAIFLCAFL
ncbi:MAG: HAD-IC family P-type ATPase, partial [Calditrichaceae bacterium]